MFLRFGFAVGTVGLLGTLAIILIGHFVTIPTALSLAEIATKIEIAYMFFWRTAEKLDKGQVPDVESSILKLTTTELSRHLANVAMEIFGPYNQLETEGEWTPIRGMAPRGYLDCISATIGAGTSEIQRSIIATRGLGLPRK